MMKHLLLGTAAMSHLGVGVVLWALPPKRQYIFCGVNRYHIDQKLSRDQKILSSEIDTFDDQHFGQRLPILLFKIKSCAFSQKHIIAKPRDLQSST